ncbi:MAG: hypothetical protein O2912_00560 [Proteobacteria bacterium]|nr:hypothetical protein [Pseudomonadota bacterium]
MNKTSGHLIGVKIRTLIIILVSAGLAAAALSLASAQAQQPVGSLSP